MLLTASSAAGPIAQSFPLAATKFSKPTDAASLWQALRSGHMQITTSYCTDRACHLEFEQTPSGSAPSPKGMETIERLVLGESQKVLSFEANCSPSTMALRVSSTLQQVGIRCTAQTIPTALIILVHAALGRVGASYVRHFAIEDGLTRCIVSMPRPKSTLPGLLTPAESAVVDLLIEARCRTDMGCARHVSVRTIANQIGQVYRKLGVSGRIPLVAHLIRRDADSMTVREWAREVSSYRSVLVDAAHFDRRGFSLGSSDVQ